MEIGKKIEDKDGADSKEKGITERKRNREFGKRGTEKFANQRYGPVEKQPPTKEKE